MSPALQIWKQPGQTQEMWNGDLNHKDGTYFINAFLLMKGARQEEAGHGVILLGEEDKILPNAHWAPEREAETGHFPKDSTAHLKKEQLYLHDWTAFEGLS